MAYNSNKGNQHMGDVQYEGDPTDVQIDFENDFIALKTNGQQRFIVSGSAITSSVLISGSQGITGNSLSTATTVINATHISSSLNISGSNFYGAAANLTNLNASNVSAGTLNNARLPATIGVTNVTASAHVSASLYYGSGVNLKALNATNITNGTLNNARLPATIGVTNVTASAHVSASLYYGDGRNLRNVNLPSVVLHSSSFTASATSDILAINSSGGVVTASLPAASTYIAGQRLSFKDVAGSGSVNNIAIRPSGSETIDGSTAGITITTNYGAIELFSNGTNSYHILSTN